MEPIHSINEFIEAVKPGDTFWFVTSGFGEPDGVQQATYLRHGEDTPHGPRIWLDRPDCPERMMFVSDLVNEFHGVHTSLESAEADLAKRREAFENDPEWQDRVRTSRLHSMSDRHIYLTHRSDPCSGVEFLHKDPWPGKGS